jgi:hypothetical protein
LEMVWKWFGNGLEMVWKWFGNGLVMVWVRIGPFGVSWTPESPGEPTRAHESPGDSGIAQGPTHTPNTHQHTHQTRGNGLEIFIPYNIYSLHIITLQTQISLLVHGLILEIDAATFRWFFMESWWLG